MTVKELRELLETLPDDMPVYQQRYDIEAGSTIKKIYKPDVKTLYPRQSFAVDAFDCTPYKYETMSTLASTDEVKSQGVQALLFI